MPKSRALLLALLVVSAILAFSSLQSLHKPVASDVSSHDAYKNARWGMTPDEVTIANHAPLNTPNTPKRFYSLSDEDGGRYRVLMSEGQAFLGRSAEVYYTFKDDKLCMYHIFISDGDEFGLDKDMRVYLTRKWGPGSPEQDDTSLKLVWQFKDQIVNYWLYQDELSVSKPFKAGLGVTYRPITES